MSYKNDSDLVIVNKYGKASGDAKAELFEAYDRLRDLTDGGASIGGSGMGGFGTALMEFARIFSPSSFLPVLGSNAINVPGTSYSSPISGGTAITPGGMSAFNFGSIGKFPSYPNVSGNAASILGMGIGVGSMLLNSAVGIGAKGNNLTTMTGSLTGEAAGVTAGTAAGAVVGTAAGAGFGRNLVMPIAGVISGIGGIVSTLGPFLGPFGMAAASGGSIASGIGGALLNAYQGVAMRILNNADTILSNKVKNIETTVKILDTQSGIIRKMIKESVEGDSKALQELL